MTTHKLGRTADFDMTTPLSEPEPMATQQTSSEQSSGGTGEEGLVADVHAAEQRRVSAMTTGDVDRLGALLGDDVRYGHASGTMDSKSDYIAKIRSGDLTFPSMASIARSHVILDDTVLLWADVTGTVNTPAGVKQLRNRVLSVWVRRGPDVVLVAHQPTALPPTSFGAIGTAPTDSAARYVKQLGSHLAYKVQIELRDGGIVAILDGGDCQVIAGLESVELIARAQDQETLDRLKRIVGGHLERFGRRDELAVSWT